jgi:hypothetical protein
MIAYALAVEEQLNKRLDRLAQLRVDAAQARRDRTYLVNLAISAAHAQRFRTESAMMRAKARELIPRFRIHARGMAITWLAEWKALLDGPDAEVIAMLTREDQHGAEMRVSSPFAGILSDEERRAALERAWAQLADEPCK